MNSIVLKVKFLDKNEIRRISINEQPITIHLIDKEVRKAYGISNTEPLIFSWKDPDQDYIRFTTQDELQEALSYVGDSNILCLSVVSKWKQQSHGEIYCCLCNNIVRGERFLCFECSSPSSLCSQCFRKPENNPHYQHALLVLRRPHFNLTQQVQTNIKKVMRDGLFSKPYNSHVGSCSMKNLSRNINLDDSNDGSVCMADPGSLTDIDGPPTSCYESLPAKLSRFCHLGKSIPSPIKKSVQHKDEKTTKALQTLYSMGYTDDQNGCLETLVKEANGDVNQVIEMISMQGRAYPQ